MKHNRLSNRDFRGFGTRGWWKRYCRWLKHYAPRRRQAAV